MQHLRRLTEPPDLSGTRYRLVHEIGRGSMGVVYEAWDAQLERLIALKAIHGAEANSAKANSAKANSAKANSAKANSAEAESDRAARFEKAKTLARLEHPGIVPIYDAGILRDGRLYCAMRLVRGQRLDRFVADKAGLFERIRAFQKICDAVAYAHNCGVVHRDLKPQNVRIGDFGEVFIMDWGVSEWLVGPGAMRGRAIVGTSRYMAPEQAAGQHDAVDGRADIFSLGAILQDVIRDDRSRPLIAIANRALAPDPAERYATVQDLISDLARFLERLPVTAYDEGFFERLSRFAERNRTLLLLLATYALVRIALFLLDGR